MDGKCFFGSVVDALRESRTLRGLGLQPGDIQCYGKGANHHDLFQVTRYDHWTVPGDRPLGGYNGVNVHFESDRPSALQLHCELTPRQGSESKADQRAIAPLLQLKGQIARDLRQRVVRKLRQLHVDMKRLNRNPADPSSLKVLGFDLRLPGNPSPSAYAKAVEPIVAAVTPLLDDLFARYRSGSPATARQAAAAPDLVRCPHCSREVPTFATYCPQCGGPAHA